MPITGLVAVPPLLIPLSRIRWSAGGGTTLRYVASTGGRLPAAAVAGLRRVMGATNPEEAEGGTIRALYASSIERNGIHGSDSPETAELELAFFFSRADLIAATG